MAGAKTDIAPFKKLAASNDMEGIHAWLTCQRWYGITGDNEHLRRFWQANFNRHPDFRPNYIVPNIHSIVRSLSSGPGLSVIPDFLGRKQIAEKQIIILWHGITQVSNTLYFARRENPFHLKEISEIEAILEQEMPK